MSIELMNMVWKRFKGGSTEVLLALSIADHARDDGTRIWPSVGLLAEKSRMDERSVRRYLRKFQEAGWLVLVRKASGRPGDTNEYRISPEWIAGRELPPPDETGGNLSPVSSGSAPSGGGETADNLSPVSGAEPVDNVIHTGDIGGQTPDTGVRTGDTAVSAESSRTIKNLKTPLPPAEAGDCGKPSSPTAGDRQRPVLRTRDQRRWRDTRSGVEWMAGELGLPKWDPGPHGVGLVERFSAFEQRVAAEAERRGVGT